MDYQKILILHAAVTWFMTGLIWEIQFVQYPLFTKIAPQNFLVFHAAYVRRIGRVVGLVMPVELGLACGLIWMRDPACEFWTWLGLVMLVLIWVSTLVLQAPLHGQLAREGYKADIIERLVRSNWVRTLLWTARALIAMRLFEL